MSGVVVIDSGVANIGSVVAALTRIGAATVVSRDWEVIRHGERVLLPGVGSAAAAMRELKALGLCDRLPSLKQPVLGVCLGMQLLFESSDEGSTLAQPVSVTCLKILPGQVRALTPGPGVRIPHMGWNALIPLRFHPLVKGLSRSDFAYFVHSYGVDIGASTLMACEHGRTFSAIVGARNFFGAQFHPERSADVGARLLGNFIETPTEQLCA